MTELCQAHVADDKFDAWNYVGPWCRQEAVTTVALSLITNKRLCEVWLCQEHLDELREEHEFA